MSAYCPTRYCPPAYCPLANFFGTIADGASGQSRIGRLVEGHRDGFYGASKHGIFSYSDSTYSVSATLRVSKHVIFRGKYSDSCPSTEYRRRNIDDGISMVNLRVSTTTRSVETRSRKTEYEPAVPHFKCQFNIVSNNDC